MSMDGFVAGPNDRLGAGLGDGGERLHYWHFGGPFTYEDDARGTLGSPSEVDQEYLDGVEFDHNGRTLRWQGTIAGGRLREVTLTQVAGVDAGGQTSSLYDLADGWGDDPGFGVPVFVVTHRPHEIVVKGNTTFEFVTDGIDAALERAREAAGDKNVIVMGGADLMRQYLAAGVVNEFTLTIAPVLLGAGKRLFDGIECTDLGFDRTAVIESPYATHLRYEVRV